MVAAATIMIVNRSVTSTSMTWDHKSNIDVSLSTEEYRNREGIQTLEPSSSQIVPGSESEYPPCSTLWDIDSMNKAYTPFRSRGDRSSSFLGMNGESTASANVGQPQRQNDRTQEPTSIHVFLSGHLQTDTTDAAVYIGVEAIGDHYSPYQPLGLSHMEMERLTDMMLTAEIYREEQTFDCSSHYQLKHSDLDKVYIRTAIEHGQIHLTDRLILNGVTLPRNSFAIALNSEALTDDSKFEMISYLVAMGAYPHARTNGDSVLHLAMATLDANHARSAVELLVEHGCNRAAKNRHGITPIRIAIQHGYLAVVEYFLSIGIKPPIQGLHDALKSPQVENKLKMVRLLVASGAKGSFLDLNGDSLLHIAIRSLFDSEATEAAHLLVQSGCNPSKSNDLGKTPVHIAVELGYVSVLSYLLLIRVVPLPSDIVFTLLESDFSSIWVANILHFFQVEVQRRANVYGVESNGADLLCNARLDEDGCSQSPLNVAIVRGRVAVVEYLLSQGVEVSKDIVSAITLAPLHVQDQMRELVNRATRVGRT